MLHRLFNFLLNSICPERSASRPQYEREADAIARQVVSEINSPMQLGQGETVQHLSVEREKKRASIKLKTLRMAEKETKGIIQRGYLEQVDQEIARARKHKLEVEELFDRTKKILNQENLSELDITVLDKVMEKEVRSLID